MSAHAYLTNLDAFQPGQPWPPPTEQERLTRYGKNLHLFRGNHWRVYNMAQRILRPELKAAEYFVLNYPKRLSRLWAQLLVGEPPRIRAEPETVDAYLEDAANRTKLLHHIRTSRIDVSRYGDAVLKLTLRDGQARLQVVPPSYWFPIVAADDVTNVERHVLAWVQTMQRGRDTMRILRLEMHEAGRITHGAHALQEQRHGDVTTLVIRGAIPLDLVTPGTAPTESTGVPWPLVWRIPNLSTSDSPYGYDDYNDIDTILMQMEARLSQMSTVLDKHAAPGMHGPLSALERNPETGSWDFKRERYLARETADDPIPGYLTWDGNLADSLAMFNSLQAELYHASDTNAAIFGNIPTGQIPSGAALRRLFMAPLAKTAEVRMVYDEVLPEILQSIAMLESPTGVRAGLVRPSIVWRDGLPEDEPELVTTIDTAIRAGIMSRREAVRRLNPDWTPDEVDAEIARIETDLAMSEGTSPMGGLTLFNRPTAELGAGDDVS